MGRDDAETLRVIAAWIRVPAAPEPNAAREFSGQLESIADRLDQRPRTSTGPCTCKRLLDTSCPEHGGNRGEFLPGADAGRLTACDARCGHECEEVPCSGPHFYTPECETAGRCLHPSDSHPGSDPGKTSDPPKESSPRGRDGATGMEPGQRCTNGRNDCIDGGGKHSFDQSADYGWNLVGNRLRCPFVEPPPSPRVTPPPKGPR